MSPLPDLRAACQALTHFPGDLPAVLPHTVTPNDHGSLRAEYRCPCGREWENRFDGVAPGWPLERVEAAA
jgi:hypothetical protein